MKKEYGKIIKEFKKRDNWIIDPNIPDHFSFKLNLKIKNNLKIALICFKDNNKINYYIEYKDNALSFMNSFEHDYSLTFSDVQDNYSRMICYLKIYLYSISKAPSKKEMKDIKYALSDIYKPNIFDENFGFVGNCSHDECEEHTASIIPFRKDDKLSLLLKINSNEDVFDEIDNSFKKALPLLYKNNRIKNCEIYHYQYLQISVIEINF